MSDGDDRSKGRQRLVKAAIASLGGGCSVTLLFPAPPVAGDPGEELGLRSPEFQSRTLQPVAVRSKANGDVEVRVAAEVLEDLLGVRGSDAVAAALGAAPFAQVAGGTWAVAGVEAVSDCLYRLPLRRLPREGN